MPSFEEEDSMPSFEEEDSMPSFEEEDEARQKKLRLRRRQAILLYAVLNLTDKAKATRKAKRKRKRKRRDPNVLVKESLQDELFNREYRMGIDAFNKLLILLEPSISPSPKNKKDDALDAKTILLMMTLRYLAGASYMESSLSLLNPGGLIVLVC
jgi:hypothetical protein